jgi:hypothetical protein
MARPLDLVVEEMLDYIEQARTYSASMPFEQYSADRKTQRAVEKVLPISKMAQISSRHSPAAGVRHSPMTSNWAKRATMAACPITNA